MQHVLKRILFFLFFISPLSLFSNIFVEKAEQLNQSLVLEKIIALESTFGPLPEDVRPSHFLLDGKTGSIERDFYLQAPKILKFIDFLLLHRDNISCRETLDLINKIFHIQGINFISTLPLMSEDANKRLLDILFRLYYCDSNNGENDNSENITYSYEKLPTAIFVTKAFINIFFVKSSRRLKFKERAGLLKEMYPNFRVKILQALERSTNGFLISRQDVDWFIDTFHKGVVAKIMPFSISQSLRNWYDALDPDVRKWIAPGALFLIIAGIGAYSALKVAASVNKAANTIDKSNNVIDNLPKALNDNVLPKLEEVGKNIGINTAKEIGNKAEAISKEFGNNIKEASKNIGVNAASNLSDTANSFKPSSWANPLNWLYPDPN